MKRANKDQINIEVGNAMEKIIEMIDVMNDIFFRDMDFFKYLFPKTKENSFQL